MRIDEIPERLRYKYLAPCSCGKICEVMTKEDGEFVTNVFVLCHCGDWIEFVLPVN